jgi:hypothetical protein
MNQHMVEHADDSVEESGVLALYIAKEPDIEKAKSMKVKNKKYLAMQETFIVKGPFGKGLGIKPTGVHVAFAAGTGVLVFLDLVTRIILHNTGVKSLGADFEDDWKFVMFISHQNLNETMGMDLCYKLLEVNKKLNIENFMLQVRLTEGRDGIYGKKQQRWATKIIREQLSPYVGNISKIWVCGPPVMNMTFDTSLEELRG